MSDVTPELKVEIQREIARHIREHGPKDWSRLAQRYPDVIGDINDKSGTDHRVRRFWRWVKAVQEGKGGGLKAAVETVRAQATQHLPAAPPPSYIARTGAAGLKNIDFLVEIRRVWDDVIAIRDWSVTEEPGSAMKIKNPVYLDTSIKRRLDVMETAMRIMQEIWDLQRMEDFYAEIAEIISEEMGPYPEAQRRVLERLKALNDKRAMTLHAEPPG